MASGGSKKVFHRERRIRLKCKMCDGVFHSSRQDKVTCGPTCRQRYKRQCDAITAQMIADKVLGAQTAGDHKRRAR